MQPQEELQRAKAMLPCDMLKRNEGDRQMTETVGSMEHLKGRARGMAVEN